jgi:hypothetical protein
MSYTLKQLCDNAIINAGTSDTLASYYGSTDKQAQKAIRAADEAVAQLRASHNWEVLLTTKSTAFTSSQFYALDSDVEYIHPDSLVNTTTGTKYISISPERAAEIESGSADADVSEVFLRSGSIKFMATVTSGETFEFKYQTNKAITAVSTTTYERFTADTDTCLIKDELVVLLMAIILRDNEGSDSRVLRERFARLYSRYTGADSYRTKVSLFSRAAIWRI